MIPYINIHTHKLLHTGIELLNIQAGNVVPELEMKSYGIHPWQVSSVNIDKELIFIKDLCNKNALAAIGEIGLDKLKPYPELQSEVFEKQLQIADNYNLPVIIHCVKSWNEILSVRNKFSTNFPWIFHGFKSSFDIALRIINSGCSLSFGKHLLNNPKLQNVFKRIPKSQVFFETDDSDLSIIEVYRKAAELCGITSDELKNEIYSNFIKVFGKHAGQLVDTH
ncbi:MAG: TatD family hydrolase [Bacteroidales bacterium]